MTEGEKMALPAAAGRGVTLRDRSRHAQVKCRWNQGGQLSNTASYPRPHIFARSHGSLQTCSFTVCPWCPCSREHARLSSVCLTEKSLSRRSRERWGQRMPVLDRQRAEATTTAATVERWQCEKSDPILVPVSLKTGPEVWIQFSTQQTS